MTHPTRRGLALLAALALATVPAACGGDDDDGGGTGDGGAATSTPAPGGSGGNLDGEALFASSCGGCHTLAAAGTGGTIGPSLDDVAPDRAQVLAAIQSGPGTMPENIYEGEEAEAVAEYVAANAGQ